MATEQEELRLVVTLDDQASAQLGNLRAQLSSMSQGIAQASGAIGGAAGGAHKAVTGLHGGLTGLAARAGFIGGVFAGIGQELAKMGVEAVKRIADIDALSRRMVEMGRAAHEMGTSTAQLRSNLLAFREGGASVEQATAALQGFSDSMADLTLVNGQLRSSLLTGGFLDLQKMQQTLEKSDAAKTVQEQAGIWRQAGKDVRAYWTELAGPQQGARREREFYKEIGADLSYLNRMMREATEWQTKLYAQRGTGSQQFVAMSEKVSDSWGRAADSAGDILRLTQAPGMVLFVRASERIAEAWEKANKNYSDVVKRAEDAEKAAGGAGPGAFRGAQAANPENATSGGPGLPWWLGGGFLKPGGTNFGGRGFSNSPFAFNPPTAAEKGQDAGGTAQRFMGGTAGYGPYSATTGGLEGGGIMAGSPLSEHVEDRRAQGENTQKTQDNTAELKRLNDAIVFGQIGSAEMPGGLAEKLGIGDIGGGGGGGGGGFRFPGGGSGPGIGSGGGDGGGGGTPGTGTGGTPGTAGYGGGAGGGAAGGVAGAASPMVGGLANVRAKFAEEMQNPRVRDRMAALLQAEVGSQGPQAKQALIESIFNRAASRGQTLERAMQRDYYEPMRTGSFERHLGRLNDQQRAELTGIAGTVMQGSNLTGFATGNASGNVGFAGGPQTFASGGERYGIEGPDRKWAERMRGQAANAPVTGGIPGGPTPGTPQFFAGGGQPVKAMTEAMAPAGTRPGTAAPGGTSIITTTSGRSLRVASDYAANFQGFLRDYEAAGGVAGPNTGGLGSRPGNPSYHPRGMAIDLNQIGYGIRGGGKNLPQAQEDALAAKWGLFPGSQFSSRSDIGHFEVRNRAAALEAQQRNLQGAQGAPPAGANQATPVTVVGVTPDASRTLAESNQRIATTAAQATAAAVKAGATPEVAAAAGAAAAQASAGGGVMDKPAGAPTTTPQADPAQQAADAKQAQRAQEDAEIARLEEIERRDAVRREERGLTPEQLRERRRQEAEEKREEQHTKEGEKLQTDAERRDAQQNARQKKTADRDEKRAERSRQRIFREKYGVDIPYNKRTNQQKIDAIKQKQEREDLEAAQRKAEEEYKATQQRESEDRLKESRKSIEELEEEAETRRDPAGAIDRATQESRDIEDEYERNKPGRRKGGTDPVTGYSSKAGKAMDASGRGIDAASDTIKVQGDGTLKVDVNAPNNTNVKASGSGLFKKTEVTRGRQMEPAEKGPTQSANQDEE